MIYENSLIKNLGEKMKPLLQNLYIIFLLISLSACGPHYYQYHNYKTAWDRMPPFQRYGVAKDEWEKMNAGQQEEAKNNYLKMNSMVVFSCEDDDIYPIGFKCFGFNFDPRLGDKISSSLSFDYWNYYIPKYFNHTQKFFAFVKPGTYRLTRMAQELIFGKRYDEILTIDIPPGKLINLGKLKIKVTDYKVTRTHKYWTYFYVFKFDESPLNYLEDGFPDYYNVYKGNIINMPNLK
jgi:hypothetical protein